MERFIDKGIDMVKCGPSEISFLRFFGTHCYRIEDKMHQYARSSATQVKTL